MQKGAEEEKKSRIFTKYFSKRDSKVSNPTVPKETKDPQVDGKRRSEIPETFGYSWATTDVQQSTILSTRHVASNSDTSQRPVRGRSNSNQQPRFNASFDQEMEASKNQSADTILYANYMKIDVPIQRQQIIAEESFVLETSPPVKEEKAAAFKGIVKGFETIHFDTYSRANEKDKVKAKVKDKYGSDASIATFEQFQNAASKGGALMSGSSSTIETPGKKKSISTATVDARYDDLPIKMNRSLSTPSSNELLTLDRAESYSDRKNNRSLSRPKQLVIPEESDNSDILPKKKLCSPSDTIELASPTHPSNINISSSDADISKVVLDNMPASRSLSDLNRSNSKPNLTKELDRISSKQYLNTTSQDLAKLIFGKNSQFQIDKPKVQFPPPFEIPSIEVEPAEARKAVVDPITERVAKYKGVVSIGGMESVQFEPKGPKLARRVPPPVRMLIPEKGLDEEGPLTALIDRKDFAHSYASLGNFDYVSSHLQNLDTTILTSPIQNSPLPPSRNATVISEVIASDCNDLLPNFFAKVRMAIDHGIPKDTRRILARHVVAYDGDIDDSPTLETTHYCTYSQNLPSLTLLRDFPKLKIVTPNWILECHISKFKLD